MEFKTMEKEISEGKRICMGVVTSELDESLPLRKVCKIPALLTSDDS
jgi:hypothetical protein